MNSISNEDIVFEEQYLKDVREIVKENLINAKSESSIKKEKSTSLKEYVWNSVNTLNCEIDKLEAYHYFEEATKIEFDSVSKKDKETNI
ncbi:MAG: hypothetical protein GX758_04285 [Tenericutes bacterium]|nr:hypothetical protein [Mycoplasmatota bacterium]